MTLSYSQITLAIKFIGSRALPRRTFDPSLASAGLAVAAAWHRAQSSPP